MERSDMTTTLANQLPRINLANGESMQSAQVAALKSGQQNASSVDSKSPMHSFELRTSSTLLRFAPESRALGSNFTWTYSWLIGNWPIAPRLPCFPLGFYVSKIGSRRNRRIVTVHSLNAKITWLKHCRNLGHAKLTA